MGNFFSKFKRKRKPEEDDDGNSPKAKRVKLGGTSGISTHIGYGMLFQQGRDSDIEVVLLGKTWKLHKSFLQQSPYFLKLLGDKSDVNKLRCSVSDWNVDCKSLELCFGYLYGGTLNFIQHSNVANVLATAKLLEMNEIVDRVAEFFIKHVNIHNSIKYYYLAEKYALQEVCDHIYQRLLLHLIPLFRSLLDSGDKLSKFLSEIKLDLLQRLVKDSDLIVVKDEYDVYLLMKKWLLSVTPCIMNGKENTENHHNVRFITENGLSYLESPQGKPFTPLFSLLDLSNMFLVSSYYDTLKADNLLPQSWLDKGLDAFWKTHVTYYDASENSQDVDRSITPLQRVRIIRREKCFTCPSEEGVSIPTPTPFRLFKRFTMPLTKPQVTSVVLNGFIFTLSIGLDNTLVLRVKVKPDVPHILIPTLLYLRFTVFDMNSIWNDKGDDSNNIDTVPEQVPQGSNLPNSSNNSANQVRDMSTGTSGTTPDFQWRSNVFSGSDLFFLLPFPTTGISRVLYDLPSGYYDQIRRAQERARSQEKAARVATTSAARAARHSSASQNNGGAARSSGGNESAARPSGSAQNEANSEARSSGASQNEGNIGAPSSGTSQNDGGAPSSGTSQNEANSLIGQAGSSQNEAALCTNTPSSDVRAKLDDNLPWLHVFVTLKMVPYFELKAAKLL